MKKLGEAVQEAHHQSAVILTLNQETIFLRNDGQLFFSDWGTAKIITSRSETLDHPVEKKTESMAPEVKELGICGLWSDIYSLGNIFMEIDRSGT